MRRLAGSAFAARISFVFAAAARKRARTVPVYVRARTVGAVRGAWAVLGVAPAAGLTAVVLARGGGLPTLFVTLTPLVGWSFAAAGVLGWRHSRRVAVLFLVVGLAWFVHLLDWTHVPALITASAPLRNAYAAVAVHLLLAFPAGRLGSPRARALAAAGYLDAVGLQLLAVTSNTFWYGVQSALGLLLAVLVVAALARRPRDPVTTAGIAAAAATTANVLASAVAPSLALATWVVVEAALAAIPLTYLAGILGRRVPAEHRESPSPEAAQADLELGGAPSLVGAVDPSGAPGLAGSVDPGGAAGVAAAVAAERRRIERDLHDGAQQRLVSVAYALGLARARLSADPATAGVALADAQSGLARALAELRRLSQGVHPGVLVERGLRAAIGELGWGAPVPVRVCWEAPERLAGAVELTGYYVVAEALANVAKHARAGEVAVAVGERDGRVTITIRDDGCGGADQGGGTGLRGLAERVAAAGGRLVVESPVGAGTTIRAELPCG